MSTHIYDVIVVGGGPGGLSAAHQLVRAGLRPLVLEQSAAVGDIWRKHYDGLKLNTGRVLSKLPGASIPKRTGGWPTRDDLAKVLEDMPARGGFEVNTGIEVKRIARDAVRGLWDVSTASGIRFSAHAVVVATGGSRIPVQPDWAGQEDFGGRIIHSSQFKNASAFKGRRVLVVGCGNSSAEIASRLTEHASAVVCSVRTPPHLLPKSLLGIPMAGWGLGLRYLPDRVSDLLLYGLQRFAIGDLGPWGLPLPTERLSVKFRETNVLPTLYVPFSQDVRANKIRIVGPIRKFAAEGVIVDEQVPTKGSAPTRQVTLAVDTVIAGTGFRTGLDELIDVPGIVRPGGRPAVTGDREFAGAPGLYFIGQSNPLTGQLREIRIEADKIARAIKHKLSETSGRLEAGGIYWHSP